MTKVMVLGAAGMTGNGIFRSMSEAYETVGTVRSPELLKYFPAQSRSAIVSHVDSNDFDSVVTTLERHRPDVVVNAIGLIKQLDASTSPLAALPINALFPHRLANLCALANIRLVHLSTDCVFDGSKGNYKESDRPTATDIYGMSKMLGEVVRPNAVTLRKSAIGHELNSRLGLVEWFLNSETSVSGFSKAIFSGLPIVELGRVIRDLIIPDRKLSGLFHVSSEPIDKKTLLELIAAEYGKSITIIPDDKFRIDRSLNSEKFRAATGYVPPSWPELIRMMKAFR